MDFKKVLILAPHTDDGELGCGGTIARFIGEGKGVYVVTFSIAQADREEYFNSMFSLGVENPQLYDFQFRVFNEKRQEILDTLIKIRKDINPDIVFLPSELDTYQDHRVISQEGFRAFKKSSILGYQMPWNCQTLKLQTFVSLEEKHIDKKIEALNYYKTQKDKFYMSPEYTKSWAKNTGELVGLPYAEVFETIRWII